MLYWFNKNVRIINNTIESSTSSLMYASHIEYLEFSNNKIIPFKEMSETGSIPNAIDLKCVKNVKIVNNKSERKHSLGVKVDQYSENVIVKSNKGID